MMGFVANAFAIPEFTETEKAYSADVVAIGQVLSYYDEERYRFYEISVMNLFDGKLQSNTITVRSINESGFDPIDPYNVFEESDLVLLYLKDYGRGFWESTNFSKVIPEGQLQNTIDKMKVTVDISSLPPLKQYKAGVPVNEIQCKNGFVQAIKQSDNSPACVTLETKQRLIERGWAEPLGDVVFQKSGQSP